MYQAGFHFLFMKVAVCCTNSLIPYFKEKTENAGRQSQELRAAKEQLEVIFHAAACSGVCQTAF